MWTPRDYAAFAREGFMQNPVVYRAVRMIAEAAAAGGGGSGSTSSGLNDERVLSDATPDNFWKPGSELAQADGQSGYPIDILEEDASGGHTFERHVKKRDEYLKARILENRTNIPGLFTIGEKRAGSFTSLEAANKLINSTISESHNAQKLQAFAAGSIFYPLPVLYLHKDFAAPTGKEAYAPDERNPEIRTTYGVTVKIVRSDKIKKGYYVESAWPTNRD